MNTRMERVAEDVALAVLRKVSTAAGPLPQLEKNFRTGWPVQGSRFPMNDAMRIATEVAVACGEPPTGLSPNPPKGGRRVSDLKPQEGAPVHPG